MDNIYLIGISGDNRYDEMRNNLLEALEEMPYDIHLEEVNEVDQIINYELSAIPALVINDVILIEQNNHIPSREEITGALEDYFSKKMLAMKNIIVPVDFSETAQNAYQYARQLAEQQGNQLKVVHICHPSVDAVSGVSVPDLNTLLEYKKKLLNQFIADDQTTNIERVVADAMVEQEVVLGFASEELVKWSNQDDTEMILMGTTGKSNLLTKWFGSVSSSVAQHANCPVWLVPPQATFKGINKVLYAGNYDSANEKTIHKIIDFAKRFDAEIQLLHIEEGQGGKDQDMEDLFLETLFKKIAPSLDYILHTTPQGSITDTLYQYAEKLNADLIVLVTHHRKFWENLLHKSTTKSMVLHAKMPLLILHT